VHSSATSSWIGDFVPPGANSLSYLFKDLTRSQTTPLASFGQYFLLEGKGFFDAIDPGAAGSGEVPIVESLVLKSGRFFARDFNFDLHVESVDGSCDVGVASKVSNRVGRSTADKGTWVFVELFDDRALETPFKRSIA